MTAQPLNSGRIQQGMGLANDGISPFLNWGRIKVPTSVFIELRLSMTGNRTSGSIPITGLSGLGTAKLCTTALVTGTGIPTGCYILSIDSATQITLGKLYVLCTKTLGQPTITMPSTVGLATGSSFVGTGIPDGTTVLTVDSSTQVTLSANATTGGVINATCSVAATATSSAAMAITLQGTMLHDAGRVDDNFNLTDTTDGDQFLQRFFLPTPAMTGTIYADVSQYNLLVKWGGGSAVTDILTQQMNTIVKNVAGKRMTFKINAAVNDAYLRWTLNGTNGGPTNIEIVPTQYESLLATGRLSDPDFVAWHDANSGRVRMMDPCSVNDSDVTTFDQLTTTSDRFWSAGSGLVFGGLPNGWPLEYSSEMINNSSLQLWVNIPHQLDDAGIRLFAEHFRDNIVYISDEVRIIFELSNEPWNGDYPNPVHHGFKQAWDYYQPLGGAAGWTTGTAQIKGCQYYGYKAAQAMEIIRDVFGTDSGHKWAGALNGQAVQPSTSTANVVGVSRHISSDPGVPVGTTVSKLFTYLTVACYYGGSYNTALLTSYNSWLMAQWALTSTETYIQNLYDVLKPGGTKPPGYTGYWGACDELSAYIAGHKVVADANGLIMDFYEGGCHQQIANPLLTNAQGEIYGPLLEAATRDFCKDPRCGQLQRDWFEQLIAANPGSKPSQFGGVGTWRTGSYFSGYQTYQDYTQARGNACQAVNFGIPYVAGRRYLRVRAA